MKTKRQLKEYAILAEDQAIRKAITEKTYPGDYLHNRCPATRPNPFAFKKQDATQDAPVVPITMPASTTSVVRPRTKRTPVKS